MGQFFSKDDEKEEIYNFVKELYPTIEWQRERWTTLDDSLTSEEKEFIKECVSIDKPSELTVKVEQYEENNTQLGTTAVRILLVIKQHLRKEQKERLKVLLNNKND